MSELKDSSKTDRVEVAKGLGELVAALGDLDAELEPETIERSTSDDTDPEEVPREDRVDKAAAP